MSIIRDLPQGQKVSSVSGEVYMEPSTGIGFSKSDLVRIILKSLNGMGFGESARHLEIESGLRLNAPNIENFWETILNGDWDECFQLFPSIIFQEGKQAVAYRMILERKYFELLENNNMNEGINCLRNEINTTIKCAERLNVLSSCLICASKSDLYALMTNILKCPMSRLELLEQIKDLLSPDQIVHDDRLEILMLQALEHQRRSCSYLTTDFMNTFSTRNTLGIQSLLFDSNISNVDDTLPLKTSFILNDHQDEVWVVSFSPNGYYLATASKDGTLRIYSTSQLPPRLLFTLKGHSSQSSIHCITWSSDSLQLLSASNQPSSHILGWDLTKYIHPYINNVDMNSTMNHATENGYPHNHGITSPSNISLSPPPPSPPITNHHHLNGAMISIENSHKYENHNEDISSMVFLPTTTTRTTHNKKNYYFISGGMDRQLILVDIHGTILAKYSTGRIGDILVLPSQSNNKNNNANQFSTVKNIKSQNGIKNECKKGKWMSINTELNTKYSYSTNHNNNNTIENNTINNNAISDDIICGFRVALVCSERWIKIVQIDTNYEFPSNTTNLTTKCDDSTTTTSTPTTPTTAIFPYIFLPISTIPMDKPIVSLSTALNFNYSKYITETSSSAHNNNNSNKFNHHTHSDGNNNIMNYNEKIEKKTSKNYKEFEYERQDVKNEDYTDDVVMVLCLAGGDIHIVQIQEIGKPQSQLTLTDENNCTYSIGKVISGQKQQRYCLRASMDGVGGLLASGSEDSNHVLIWLVEDGALLTKLKGHTGMVNCVSWCPSHPGGGRMLASASDDHTVRIWASQKTILNSSVPLTSSTANTSTTSDRNGICATGNGTTTNGTTTTTTTTTTGDTATEIANSTVTAAENNTTLSRSMLLVPPPSSTTTASSLDSTPLNSPRPNAALTPPRSALRERSYSAGHMSTSTGNTVQGHTIDPTAESRSADKPPRHVHRVTFQEPRDEC